MSGMGRAVQRVMHTLVPLQRVNTGSVQGAEISTFESVIEACSYKAKAVRVPFYCDGAFIL
jgi:hypothetical protein